MLTSLLWVFLLVVTVIAFAEGVVISSYTRHLSDYNEAMEVHSQVVNKHSLQIHNVEDIADTTAAKLKALGDHLSIEWKEDLSIYRHGWWLFGQPKQTYLCRKVESCPKCGKQK